jgi:SAM-dependent methyltransferase
MSPLPRLYADFAAWWPLLSRPEDYAEEAGVYARILREHAGSSIATLLELGAGGGNNARHLKSHFQLTLVDLSDGMLAHSRRLNPECEHHVGDMRHLRLGREFDAVFVHDAIDYMTSLDDLRLALRTAFVHCRPGGVALFAPDHVRELFRTGTDCGGHDGADRALRYLEWTWDPDPEDSTYVADYAYLFRHPDGTMTVEHDRHVGGLFRRHDWLDALSAEGFSPVCLPFEHSQVEPGTVELFVGRRKP